MNKIFKVIYSKTKHCYVVVSELAKSHCKSTVCPGKSKTALTAAVLLALGTFSFVGMPVVQADADPHNNDFIGANDYYWYWDAKKSNWEQQTYRDALIGHLPRKNLPNNEGAGAKETGAIAAGLYAQAGMQTVTIGNRNAGQSRGSVFIGEHSGYDDKASNIPKGSSNNYVTSVGFQSDATGWGSIAIGSNAKAENTKKTDSAVSMTEDTDENKKNGIHEIEKNPTIEGASVALGYSAHSKDGNIAIGSYSDATTTTDKTKTAYTDKDVATSYVSVGSTKTQRRITNVADGADASDVATVGQLQKAITDTGVNMKANIDASNIGNNIKVYKTDEKGQVVLDGNKKPIEDTVATETAQQTNENKWGAAIGTGKVEKGNGQLVTGGTVYTALDNQKKDLSVHAGWGIKVAKDKDGNAISLNRNLGKDYDTTDGVNLKNDTAGTSLILGGRVEKGSPTGGQSITDDYGALGKDSVTVGGVDNTVETTGDAAVVVGGIYNKAVGQKSAVVGGSANDAVGNESSVFGGNDNDAYGTYATLSGGSWNKAYGNASSIFGGSVNDVSGNSSVAVGGYGSHVYGNASVGIAGGSTNADYALAAGREATVTVNNGTAIGYQATSNKEGTVAFGHDKDDVYYTSTWPQKATEKDGKYYDANNKEITKAEYESLRNADLTFNDYSQKPTVTENKYGSASYNRLVKVADGVDDHDVVVMEQLNKAKADLTNSLSINPGWGINIADEKDPKTGEVTKKNVISLK